MDWLFYITSMYMDVIIHLFPNLKLILVNIVSNDINSKTSYRSKRVIQML